MEGRIGVAITVLLTLSTESAGAREHLPSVSYLKVSVKIKSSSNQFNSRLSIFGSDMSPGSCFSLFFKRCSSSASTKELIS